MPKYRKLWNKLKDFIIIEMFKFKTSNPNSICISNCSAAPKAIKENGITVFSDSSPSSSKKSVAYVDQEHSTIRSLVFTVLTEYIESKKCVVKPVKCLDACGSSGVNGLMWKKHFGNDVNVIINDDNKDSYKIIQKHAETNNVEVEVVSKDPCILLYECAFNFIYLDCKTEASFYLDAAFRHISRNGILIITTKDDSSLQVSNPDVAFRRYGGHIVRTCYLNELAVRIVVAAMARAAAKYNKGFKVLCCVSFKNTFTIAVMIQKGPLNADNCLKNVKVLYHCAACEDRAFQPHLSGFNQNRSMNTILKSKCQNISHTIQQLGPLWGGEIFDELFIKGMIVGKTPPYDPNLKAILLVVLEEARCPTDNSHEREVQNEEVVITPPLYYNLHKHHPKMSQLKSVIKVIKELRKAGYRASRTHFDKLAVRTNAPVDELYEIMLT